MTLDGRRLRVLWLVKGLGPGGMERLLVHHARVGDRNRFEYSVAYLVPRPESVVDELEGLGVVCTRLGSASGNDPRWLTELRQLILDQGIDVVHAHSPMPAAMARPMLRSIVRGVRIVYTEHNTWECYGLPTRAANAVTYPMDHATFAVSADARSSVPKLLRRRVEVLTHGIDLDEVRAHASERPTARESLGVREDDVLIVTLAHLRQEKGHDVLLEAAAEVLRRDGRAMFVVAGHGPLENELRARLATLGLGDRFRFLGFRQDALALLAAADVFCLSSRQEGLPVAYMEACALGVPTVATRVGGLAEHVEPEHSGLLVPADDVTALASALTRVVTDPALRGTLGEGASAAAPQFDARRAVQRQEQVYQQLAGPASPGWRQGTR